MRVLVIEDDIALSASLKHLMEDQGYACDVAHNGEDGLFCGLEYAIDVAVDRCWLASAKAVLRLLMQLRSRRARPFPIMLLTARDRWQDKVTGLESGADDYLTKPFP